MGTWSQLNFQDANSPLMEELSHLHDYINLILMFIITFVGVILFTLALSSFINTKFIEVQSVEWVWTLFPAILLLQIALPSLLLLYMLDESADASLLIKTLGNQWYWSYEYTDINYMSNMESVYNSYMIPTNDLDLNGFRLLDVDNRTVLPIHTQIRMLTTSTDVLHSWTVPSLGVKADAVPGRLNHLKFMSHRPGVYFGQCSEICGSNHSFMPIVVEMVDYSSFTSWILTNN